MKVLVCGSRDWTDRDAIASRLSGLPGEDGKVTVIQGGARGADTMAATAARELGFDVQTFPADWDKHGKSAGFIRNVVMLQEKPDLVIAFQTNGSRGTQHTIDQARKRGIPVEVSSA